MKYLQKMCSFNWVKIVGDLYFFYFFTIDIHIIYNGKAYIRFIIRFISLSLVTMVILNLRNNFNSSLNLHK